MADGAFDLPEGVAAMEFCGDGARLRSPHACDFIQRSNFRQRIQLILAQLGHTMDEIANRSEWSEVSLTNQCLGGFFAQSASIAEAEA